MADALVGNTTMETFDVCNNAITSNGLDDTSRDYWILPNYGRYIGLILRAMMPSLMTILPHKTLHMPCPEVSF
jgi:hypothetical protein